MKTTPGDIVLTGKKAQGVVSLAIKLGSKLRYGLNSPHTKYSHAALVVGYNGELVEAQGRGVKRANISKYALKDYDIVLAHVDEHDRKQVVDFADSVVEAKTKYGVLTFIGLAIYCATAPLPFIPTINVQGSGTAICSGFVCDALTRAGFTWQREPYVMMPSDIAAYFSGG